MEKTFLSYLPHETFANILCYLDTPNLNSIVKTFSLSAVKYYEIWKYMIQLTYSKELMVDIINSEMVETQVPSNSKIIKNNFQPRYTWPDLYMNIKNSHSYIRVIANDFELKDSIYTHYIVLNHRFSMHQITFRDDVKYYYRNNLDTIKNVNFNFLFRLIFYKIFPREYSILMKYNYSIKWHNLYPNLIAIVKEKVDRDVKMSSFWDICLTDFDQEKWKNYPEMIYLFDEL